MEAVGQQINISLCETGKKKEKKKGMFKEYSHHMNNTNLSLSFLSTGLMCNTYTLIVEMGEKCFFKKRC